MEILQPWHRAAMTTVGLFWMAFWAFGLGYLISSLVQVFVTRERMRGAMGGAGPKSIALGTVFGFISSSCSFAALATTRSLFAKGAGLIPSLAFLLASTNLVIELGIVIAVFLSWQFVVGEYVGGILLISSMWGLVRLTYPGRLVREARARARDASQSRNDTASPDCRRLLRTREGWRRVAQRYVMEWGMVWKDVLVGFTVAGIIATFVPQSFFRALFVGAGSSDPSLGQVALQAIVGPVAAFFTFIGSMGNIPLAAVLFGHGVSFAGIMAFIFSDLVVFPVLRIQAGYYGWKAAWYIVAVFLTGLVASALILHYGFAAVGWLPDAGAVGSVLAQRDFFALDYTFVLNIVFVAMTLTFVVWKARVSGLGLDIGQSAGERVLFVFAVMAAIWIVGGLAVGGGTAGGGRSEVAHYPLVVP